MEGWVGAGLMLRWGKEGGFTKLREVGRATQQPGPDYSYCVRVGQLPRYSQVLLLPLGVPPTPAPAMLHTKSDLRQ